MKDPIVQEGEQVLREVAKPVAHKDLKSRALRALLTRMKKILKAEEFGVAIAAPQVGKSLRIFIVSGRALLPEDAPKDAPIPKDLVFINPEITRLSKSKREMAEGCLSVRGKYGTVMRHERASVKALDENGKGFTYNGTGLMAHIFQHECDHLEGILYIDKAKRLTDDSTLSRKALRKEFPAGERNPSEIDPHE
jgi:peptide deformylase